MARPAFLPDTGDDDYWERQKRELASLGQQVARDPLQAALGALDIGAWRIPIEAPAGLLGIAGQKALEALGGGRGEQERAVTEAVTRETEGMSPFQRALSTAFLYPAAASEAFRVSHQRAKERDEIPTADLPVVGKVSPFDVGALALPATGLLGAAGKARNIPAALRAVRKGAPTPKGVIASREAALRKAGQSEAEAASTLQREFGPGRAQRYFETKADIARVEAPVRAAPLEAIERAPRAIGALAPQIERGAQRVGEVVEFPKVPTEAAVPQAAPTRARILAAAAEAPPTDVGTAMRRAVENKNTRMRNVADKVTRGEKIGADQADEFLTFLKETDPANATEYDRMLAGIGRAESAAQGAIAQAKATAQEAKTAQRAAASAGRALTKAEETAARPIAIGGPSAAPGRAPKAGLTTAEVAPVTRTGYATLRDEEILERATINTGKVDDPMLASEMAETIRRGGLETFERGTPRVPLEETRVRAADYLGLSPEQLETEIVRRGMTANENAAFLTAVNDTLVRLAGDLHSAASKGGAEFAAAEARFLGFARSAGGANSEAGRTLSALRLQRPRAYIEAQYARDVAQQAAKGLAKAERAAAKIVQFPEAAQAGRAAMVAAQQRKLNVDRARAAYEAATRKANDAAIRAQTAALGTTDLAPGVRRYIASLDPNDVDAVIDAIKVTARPGWGDQVASVMNTPRALLASFDLSAPLRQGALLSAAHPFAAGRAFRLMLGAAAKDEKFANRALNELLVGEGSARRKAAGLYIGDWRTGALAAREEAFMTNLAQNIPVVGQLVHRSERAYFMFLNKLRTDVFDGAVRAWDRAGVVRSAQEEQALASFINHASGRGDLPGPLASSGALLSSAFFAPRLHIGRVQTLGDALSVIKQPSSRASRMAATDTLKFAGAGLAVLQLALLGGLKVEADPRSAVFGRIEWGPHQIDIWGGFQDKARYLAQIILGQTKTDDGRIIAVSKDFGATTRAAILGRFLRGKLSPSVGTAYDVLEGQNIIGEEVTPQEIIEGLVQPLFFGDLQEAVRADTQDTLRALTVAGLAFFGAGLVSDTKPGRWGVPDIEVQDDPVEAKVRALAAVTDRKGEPIIGSLRPPQEDAFGSAPNEALQRSAGRAGYEAVQKAMAEVDFSGLSTEDQAKRIQGAVERAHRQSRLETAADLIRGLYGPVSDDAMARAIEIGLASNVSQTDRAKWVERWAEQGALTPEIAAAFDSVRDKDKTLTIEQYLEAAPLLRQVEQMPEFAQLDGSPLGSPSQWAQYHAEAKEWERIQREGGRVAARVYLGQHPVLRRFSAYTSRPLGKNPLVTRLRQRYPILGRFTLLTDTD